MLLLAQTMQQKKHSTHSEVQKKFGFPNGTAGRRSVCHLFSKSSCHGYSSSSSSPKIPREHWRQTSDLYRKERGKAQATRPKSQVSRGSRQPDLGSLQLLSLTWWCLSWPWPFSFATHFCSFWVVIDVIRAQWGLAGSTKAVHSKFACIDSLSSPSCPKTGKAQKNKYIQIQQTANSFLSSRNLVWDFMTWLFFMLLLSVLLRNLFPKGSQYVSSAFQQKTVFGGSHIMSTSFVWLPLLPLIQPLRNLPNP